MNPERDIAHGWHCCVYSHILELALARVDVTRVLVPSVLCRCIPVYSVHGTILILQLITLAGHVFLKCIIVTWTATAQGDLGNQTVWRQD